VRPEHLGLEGHTTIPSGNNKLQGKVEVVEPLGAETDLLVDIGGQSVVAKVDGHAAVKVGDMVTLVADVNQLHAFDLQTEAAIGR
jgi:multiple sugar transport system ATP-binding protein